MLGEKSLFVHGPELDVVFAFYIIKLCVAADIGEKAKLADGFPLQAWRAEIGERILAWVIVVLIAPREGAQREHGVVIEDVCPSWRDVVSADARTLVGRADGLTREGTAHRNGDAGIQVIERVRRLKPRRE